MPSIPLLLLQLHPPHGSVDSRTKDPAGTSSINPQGSSPCLSFPDSQPEGSAALRGPSGGGNRAGEARAAQEPCPGGEGLLGVPLSPLPLVGVAAAPVSPSAGHRRPLAVLPAAAPATPPAPGPASPAAAQLHPNTIVWGGHAPQKHPSPPSKDPALSPFGYRSHTAWCKSVQTGANACKFVQIQHCFSPLCPTPGENCVSQMHLPRSFYPGVTPQMPPTQAPTSSTGSARLWTERMCVTPFLCRFSRSSESGNSSST